LRGNFGLSSVVVMCTTLSAYMRVAHGEYMPTKIDERHIELVLSSRSIIVLLKQLQKLIKI
jgi:hypothetical protein